ncbi:uncharacterized protein TRIREDRAFT_111517 [Trichoderma reesei QM6a]|jgi:hypothetical protein|uniref:Predicted protein n=2 Tax=Hypocrea jecorina TaxID=51453 RepID=G0RUT2_HYPJQ|nr:uncharacterized protein TRIREDRAFT_111517 [Trichoderma reesei QM6a]EGR45052.1 predicted protein [Trichoderma reesei QM6a]ETR98207.1 hypothetical protein M419DRAFT_89453 [Trichoderma reesei RUT C-30]
MSNQPAEDLPQGWSMVFSHEDALAMETQPLFPEMELLAQFLQEARQAELREANVWKDKTTAEIGRRLAGLKL